jgi:hypothetical protein
MLKIQEIDINGNVYRVRQATIRLYREGQGLPPDELIYHYLAGMLVDASDKVLGAEGVMELPLEDLENLAEYINKMLLRKTNPLTESDAPSSALQ